MARATHAGTWTLPPVRTPAPRAVRLRPVLMLVEQELDDDAEGALAPVAPASLDVVAARSIASLAWREPRTIALAIASVLAAGFVTTAVVWTAIARRDASIAMVSLERTTLSSALASSTTRPAPPSPAIAVPVVDVNSLPPAPNRVASGAAR